jgi:hypothetical protein
MTTYTFKIIFEFAPGCWQMRLVGTWAVCRRLAGPGERIVPLGG